MMTGRKIAMAALFFVSALAANAQQKPHYSQYVQNMSVINPAVTGMYKGIHVKAGMRNQWQGLESAPRTSYFTISSPVAFGGNYSTQRASDFGVIEPATKADRLGYESSANHHAMGA